MHAVPEKLTEIVDTFQMIEDRSERIDLLISLADGFREVPARVASRPFPEENKVPHCESEAYVFPEDLPDGTLKFHFAVENPQGISAMATAVVLDRGLSGQPLDQVAQVSGDLVYDVFGHELSTGKGLGLTGIVALVRQAARKKLAPPGADLSPAVANKPICPE